MVLTCPLPSEPTPSPRQSAEFDGTLGFPGEGWSHADLPLRGIAEQLAGLTTSGYVSLPPPQVKVDQWGVRDGAWEEPHRILGAGPNRPGRPVCGRMSTASGSPRPQGSGELNVAPSIACNGGRQLADSLRTNIGQEGAPIRAAVPRPTVWPQALVTPLAVPRQEALDHKVLTGLTWLP